MARRCPLALGLSALFAVLYVAWFIGLVTVVGVVAGRLRRPQVKAWTERVTGAALVAFGARLAAAGRP